MIEPRKIKHAKVMVVVSRQKIKKSPKSSLLVWLSKEDQQTRETLSSH